MSRDIDLLVVGEVNPDVVVWDPDPRPVFGQAERFVEGIRLTIGSSSAITACGAARLGLAVSLVGVVGDDALGRFTLDALADRGVDVSACRVAPGRATGASVILGNGTDRAILTAMGTIADVRAADVPAALLARARHVHVGSYFLQPGLAAEVPALFRAARAAGATTSLDPNWDPSGTWDGGFRAAAAEADVLLPNAAECRALAGVEDLEAAALALASVDGVPRRTVAVKDGSDGRAGGRPGRRAGPRRGDRRRRRRHDRRRRLVQRRVPRGLARRPAARRRAPARGRVRVAVDAHRRRDGRPADPRGGGGGRARRRCGLGVTTSTVPGAPIRRVVGVALNAAVDKTVSVDRLVAGAIHRPVVRSVVAGGKAANVVRAAGHLGLDGAMVAVLGGHAGAWYREALAEPVDRPARGLGRGRDTDLPVGARRGDRRADRVLRGRRPAGRGGLGAGRGRPPRGDRR